MGSKATVVFIDVAEAPNNFCHIVGIKIFVRNFPDGPVAKLHVPNAGSLGSNHDQGTISHMPHLRVCMSKLRCSTAK